jgi:hypothetical protein
MSRRTYTLTPLIITELTVSFHLGQSGLETRQRIDPHSLFISLPEETFVLWSYSQLIRFHVFEPSTDVT